MSTIQENLRSLIGEDVTVWGPYMCADGRQRIDIKPVSASRSTTHQFAKIVLELKLGRRLTSDETVDYIDGDKTNDCPSNLRVLSLSENAADSAKRLLAESFICPTCSVKFELEGDRLKNALSNNRKGKVGPFCGRSCAGKYGAAVQNGTVEAMESVEMIPTYYSRKGLGV